jgi:hypothetical protein
MEWHMLRRTGLFVLTALAVLSTPAFASGLGPAPHYSPDVGAPASQRGQSAQTLTAEAKQSAATNAAVGGVADGKSDSGRRDVQKHH